MMMECPVCGGRAEPVLSPISNYECPLCRVELAQGFFENMGLAHAGNPDEGGIESNPLGTDFKTHFLDKEEKCDVSAWEKRFRRIEKGCQTRMERHKLRAFDIADKVAGRYSAAFPEVQHMVYREIKARADGKGESRLSLPDFARLKASEVVGGYLSDDLRKAMADKGEFVAEENVECQLVRIAGALGIPGSSIESLAGIASTVDRPAGIETRLFAGGIIISAGAAAREVAPVTGYSVRILNRAARFVKENARISERSV